MKKLVVGITGASGSVYFLRLIENLTYQNVEVHVIATEQGERVLAFETGADLRQQIPLWNRRVARVVLQDNNNLFAGIASGSFRSDGMVILPCSMSTVAELALGCGKTLLTRAADVMMKEHRKLIVVPRETPLSAIHLGNMHTLAQMGVVILPAMPGFYGHPQSLLDAVDFVVGKVMDSLGLIHENYPRWEGIYEEN